MPAFRHEAKVPKLLGRTLPPRVPFFSREVTEAVTRARISLLDLTTEVPQLPEIPDHLSGILSRRLTEVRHNLLKALEIELSQDTGLAEPALRQRSARGRCST